LEGLRLRARLLAGFVAGLGLFVPGLWWSLSFNAYGGVVLMVVQSLAPALACGLAPHAARGRGAAVAGAMVLVEALRTIWPFGGLPIGGLALGQAAGPLGGAARLGGPLGLVGLVWLGGGATGVLVVTAVRAARRRVDDRRARLGWQQLAAHAARVGYASPRDEPPRSVAVTTDTAVGDGRPSPVTSARAVPVLGPILAVTVTAAAVVGMGAWGAVAPDGGPSMGTVRVAAVQGGGARGLRMREVSPASVFAAQTAATGLVPAHDGGRAPALVVWPEDTVALNGRLEGSAAQTQLADLARRLQATLVVGVTESVSDTRFLNEIVAFDPSGRVVARFEKVHRVPFGEYIPYRSFFRHLADLSSVPLDAIPGHGDGVLRTPSGPLGTMVSYEVFYAERGRIATRAGAQLLVDPTNTASYATSQVPAQEIAAARLQAIAEGRDLVQAAPTGYSAVIDHRGTVRARSDLSRPQVIVRDVALRTGATLYERGGDPPAIALAALLVVAGWIAAFTVADTRARTEAARRERRARGPGTANRTTTR
jgi:apolipoprotein N-acyltransferase